MKRFAIGKTAEKRRRQLLARRSFMAEVEARRIANSIRASQDRSRLFHTGISLPTVSGPTLAEIEAKYGK